MNKLGYIYFTEEINSDGETILHNGLPKYGIGRTNDNTRRFKEHHSRGSKASVGVEFIYIIDCDEIGIIDVEIERRIHRILENSNFINIDRISHYEETELKSTTEVYSGKSNKEIPEVFKKGEALSLDLFKRIIKNIYNVDLFKHNLVLYPHQKEAYEFIIDRFNKGFTNVLLNHKPRSGKSFICYHYMIENPQNILLFTQFPILNGQWKSEFEMLRGHDYNIINVRELEGKKVILDKTKPNFVLISLQDGKGVDTDVSDNEIVAGLNKSKFSQIKKVQWGTIIFDEIHKGKETPKTDKLLNGLRYDKLIGLSATPTKNILRGTFNLDNTHRYTLVDEKKYKRLYPSIYKNPDIIFNLFNIDDNVKKTMKYFEENENHTFAKFMEVSNGDLVYKNDFFTLFSWLFSKGKYNRRSGVTHKVINKSDSILMFVENNASQEHIANVLKKLVGDVYDIYFTNSEINSSHKLLEKIKSEFIPKDKKVIIIANKQLTTGITLKYCDCVIFMNDWKSVDDWTQASYRCQTPLDGKDECFVIDLNPSRVYNILHSYIESNSSFQKYDINDAIKEYLDCVPVFESFGKELKRIDFEEFKSRVVDSSGIVGKFFPKSILNSDEEIYLEKENLLKLGELDSGGIIATTLVKLDETQPDAGKTKTQEKHDRETIIRQTDEYKELMEKLIGNAGYLLERTNLLSLSTEFKYDNIDAIFEELDNNEEKREEYLKGLLI